MNVRTSVFTRSLIAISVVVFILAGTLGLANFSVVMEADEHGHRAPTDCLIPGMATLCSMNPLEHIATWQNSFLALPEQTGVFSILSFLILAVLAVGFSWLTQQYPPPKKVFVSFRDNRANDSYYPIKSFQELFSNGILNPKVF